MGGMGGLSFSSLFSEIPSPSQPLPEETVTVSTARGGGEARNPSVLVDSFVDGVNEASASPVWAAPTGKQFTDLGRALQLHVAAEAKASAMPMPRLLCKRLGGRWAAWCEGAPDDAWKAAAWLGKGAPARKPPPKVPREPSAPKTCEECRRPTTAGKLCTDCRRRSDQAKQREEQNEREKSSHSGPPPPDVQDRLNGLLRPLPASGKIRKADEQIVELEALQRAEGAS